MSKDYIELLQDKETGEFYAPYTSIICKTEEDFKKIQAALEKQKATKPQVLINDKDVKVGCVTFKKGTKTYKCICRCHVSLSHDYCYNCGQKLDWSELNASK